MLDIHILADRVSLLLKTRYREITPAERPFDLAFNEVMDRAGVIGSARGVVKSEVGKILSARPRKTPTKKKVRVVG